MPSLLKLQIETPREPAARPVGDSVLITAHTWDDTGVDSVLFTGLSFRGDPSLGTDSTLLSGISRRWFTFPGSVRDTTVSRYLHGNVADTTAGGHPPSMPSRMIRTGIFLLIPFP